MEYNILSKKNIDFSDAPAADISVYKWETGYSPRAFGQLIFVEKKGFALKMTAFEIAPKRVYTEYNQPVYKDSCLEFFVSFDPGSPLYMNFEMNSAGAFLSAVRKSRSEKTPIHKLARLPDVTAGTGDGCWTVDAFFDLSFIEKLFGKSDFGKGSRFKGNFYKCGDETERPHFGMWAEIKSEKPDFHRPEFFGDFIIV